MTETNPLQSYYTDRLAGTLKDNDFEYKHMLWIYQNPSELLAWLNAQLPIATQNRDIQTVWVNAQLVSSIVAVYMMGEPQWERLKALFLVLSNLYPTIYVEAGILAAMWLAASDYDTLRQCANLFRSLNSDVEHILFSKAISQVQIMQDGTKGK